MDTQPHPVRNICTQGVGSVVSEANKRNLAELYKELNKIKFQRGRKCLHSYFQTSLRRKTPSEISFSGKDDHQ